jgi:UDP:flavonoid glycosyltransferase YjiC (YdhE family)
VRYLFVVPPLAGHINPTIGVAAALRRRGHEVAWAGSTGALLGPDYRVYPCDVPRGQPERPADLRGLAALKFLWERFLIPLTVAMVPGVRAAVADFRPDLLVVDQQALAGAIVAGELGLPWVTSSTTSAELTDPLASMPKVLDWIHEQLAGLRRDGGDPRFSPYLILAFTTSALTGPVEALGDRIRFVGPSMAARPPTDDFPWGWLDRPGPRVLVSLGTVNADAGVRFLRAAVQAFADRPALSAVLVDPGGVVGPAPENVLACSRVPQLELLPRLDAVVCHAGHNTVCESLYHALPLVVAPIRDDQPVVAQQVVDAGAGVRIRFGRATDAHIGAAVDDVLTNPSYRAAARRVQASFAAAGGAEAAADALECAVTAVVG